MRLFIFSISLLVVLFLFGCDKIGLTGGQRPVKVSPATYEVKGTVVAKVNNEPIMLEDLDQDINAYNSTVPAGNPDAKITTQEQKVNYLKNVLVQRALLAQAAADKGLDRNDDVARALQRTRQELLLMTLFKEIADTTEITPKEIEDTYNANKEQFREPEQRKISEIVVSGEQDANDIMIQLLQGGDFTTLARDRSKAKSAKNGGDLGFIKRGDKSAQFDAVAFADSLETGRVSQIFKTPDGYCIIKLEAKKGGQLKSLDDSRTDIKNYLTNIKQQKKLEDLVGKLSGSAKIEIYEGKIK
jgi:parvulin-like peptidyl-prolyl isomerase